MNKKSYLKYNHTMAMNSQNNDETNQLHDDDDDDDDELLLWYG